MKRFSFCIIILLVATPVHAAVLLYDGFEYSNFLQNSGGADGGLHLTNKPDYCVIPDPPDSCSSPIHPDASCTQSMGPIYSIPDDRCRHALNLGGTGDSFPVVAGSQSYRAYVHASDPDVKGHTGRAELTVRNSTSSGVSLDAPHNSGNGADRWLGFALYVPSQANHTYMNVTFIQWHNDIPGRGEPLLFRLDGGPDHPYYQGYRWQAAGSADGYEKFMEIPADNDFDKWVYWVIHVRFDRDGSDGVIEAWKWTDGQQPTKVIDRQNWVYGYSANSTAPYMKTGITWDNTITDRPQIYYFDEWRIGDSNSSFEEVRPDQGATTSCSTASPQYCTETECGNIGLNWCTDTCQQAACGGATKPPLTIIAPTSQIAYGTTTYTTRLSSGSVACNATFMYSPEQLSVASLDYTDLDRTPDTTGGITHERDMSLSGASFYQYWGCEVDGQEADIVEVHIDVAPAGDPDLPEITDYGPTGTQEYGIDHVYLYVVLSKQGSCKYSQTQGLSYAAMENHFTDSGDAQHYSEPVAIGTYRQTYYARCEDTDGNITGETTITFNPRAQAVVHGGVTR